MKTYQVDRSKVSDGQLSKDLTNLFGSNPAGKEFAFDILMTLAFGVTLKNMNETNLILRRPGFSYELPIK